MGADWNSYSERPSGHVFTTQVLDDLTVFHSRSLLSIGPLCNLKPLFESWLTSILCQSKFIPVPYIFWPNDIPTVHGYV